MVADTYSSNILTVAIPIDRLKRIKYIGKQII